MNNDKVTNIIDYLKWRGDLSFNVDAFNEIDALILSRFSYLSLDDIVDENTKTITIKKAYEIYAPKIDEVAKYSADDPKLFELMASSKRYCDLKLKYYANRFSENLIEQFSAITIEIDKKCNFVSFRGTDNTINGWKEDLLMTFDDEVPSQEDAIAYLNKVANLTKGTIYIGGHSKGGNLAIYAALFCDEKIAKRIDGIYSFDGPGLHKSVLEHIENNDVLPNIVTYIPQSSIFGKMLNHKEHIITVHSNATGALQHDIYSWTVVQKQFHITKQETITSKAFDKAFHDYLANLDKSEREQVVKIIFDAIEECECKTMEDLTKHLIFNLIKVMKHLNHLETSDSELVKEALGIIGDSLKNKLGEELTSIIKH